MSRLNREQRRAINDATTDLVDVWSDVLAGQQK